MSRNERDDVRGGQVAVSGVRKQYKGMTAVDDITVDVPAGDFVTLLGPSGCGKTTLLRIIAGFIGPDTGTVSVDGVDITGKPPHRRPVNTVFQKPILLPHLNVFQNVAFGLQASGVRGAEIARRVSEILSVVRLSGYENRRSDELSGGQAQRVSLARALVNQPRLLLLDEPLSALDLQVRLEMQAELKRINRETGITFLYVTHDQQEAMAMSDRLAVLEAGRVRQLATPREVYDRPASSFVARFVGNANVVPVVVARTGSTPQVRLDESDVLVDVAEIPEDVERGWISIRPESLTLAAPGKGIDGAVTDVSFLGSCVSWRVAVDGHELRVTTGTEELEEFRVGGAVSLAYHPARVTFLTT